MIPSIVSAIMNWFALSVLMPIGLWLTDYWRIKKENSELKKVLKDFKDAKTKTDIDSSIDNLP